MVNNIISVITVIVIAIINHHHNHQSSFIIHHSSFIIHHSSFIIIIISSSSNSSNSSSINIMIVINISIGFRISIFALPSSSSLSESFPLFWKKYSEQTLICQEAREQRMEKFRSPYIQNRTLFETRVLNVTINSAVAGLFDIWLCFSILQ